MNPHNIPSLTPSHILKATKFLVKILQSKFLVTRAKIIFKKEGSHFF